MFTPSYLTSGKGEVEAEVESTVVLTPSLENAFAKIGGVGAVVADLAEEFTASKLPVQNHVLSPDYDFLADEPKKFICKIRHMHAGVEIESNVYETDSRGYKQLLVSPAEDDLQSILAIGGAHAIYSHNTNSSLLERGSYLASATAAFVALQNEERKTYDIVHQHSWATALTKRLVEQKLPDSGKRPKFITTIHGMLGEVAMAPIGMVRGAGVELPASWEAESFNLFYEAIDNTDRLIMVSKFLFDSACTADVPLRGEYIAARDSGRMRYLSNGISLPRVSPLLSDKVFFDSTHVVRSKELAKETLAEKGVVSQPERPLFLYVGRFSPEKGVASLPDMIRHIISAGGDVVIVGKGDPELARGIEDLKLEDGVAEHLFLSLNDDEFQRKNLSLLRAGADFQLIPSRQETCGLVAMEAIANGAIMVTTAAQGLAEIARPVEKAAEGVDGNAFIYSSDGHSYKEAIDHAVSLYVDSEADKDAKELYISRLMKEGEAYSWGVAAQHYTDLYDEITPDKPSHSLAPHEGGGSGGGSSAPSPRGSTHKL